MLCFCTKQGSSHKIKVDFSKHIICCILCVQKCYSILIDTTKIFRGYTNTVVIANPDSTLQEISCCTAGFLHIIRLYCPLHFPKVIPRHIPRDILPRRLFTAGSRRSGDAIPPQLARYAVVDVICTGTQTCRRCGCSFICKQWCIASDLHRLTFYPLLSRCSLCRLSRCSLEPVQPFLTDGCRVVRVALVHVHIAPNAAHLARAGLLPDAVLSVVGGLIHAVVCHPDSVPCP